MEKNILLFTLEYPPFKGGVSRYYENIVKYWRDAGHIHVLNDNGHKLVNPKLRPQWLGAVFALKKEIKKKKIGHVIVGHILPLGIAMYFVSFFDKIPYTVILHGMDLAYTTRKPRKKLISRLILKKADKIICANTYTKEMLKKEYGREVHKKAAMINPGAENTVPYFNKIKQEEIRKKYDLKGEFVIFSLGRLVKRKGFDKMIEAMPLILKKQENTRYFIAGVGPDQDYLRKKLSEIPKKDQSKITFLGRISEEDKWAWFSICDVFAMPCREIGGDFEGFGVVFLEANVAGKPVIAGDSGGVGDAVKDRENGLLVDPEDINDIVMSTIELGQKIDLRYELGEKGMRRALEKFNWKYQVEKIYQIINNN